MNPDKNILSQQSSPYLKQHADNPVHWQIWDEEVLNQARISNKPILLSIGYSACHWCHVMAHESFEDEKTAALMNELFINIKVDKEERPDLDKIYQNAHSLLTERAGGWPLTVFLTPDTRMPIFAGTYFPREARHGLPAFSVLLQHISEIWQTRQEDITKQSGALQSTYQKLYESTRPDKADFNYSLIDIARNQVEHQFDHTHGGYSSAPKFPHPAILEFALKHWLHTSKRGQPDSRILHSAVYTLDKMADGGLFDHLGGGFFRYSTDNYWMIPHFEKMLYDNGPLLSLYSQLWRLDKNLLYLDTATSTADWVIREMQADAGGYYSAQDADTEDGEGRFFVWSKQEIGTMFDQVGQQENITPATIKLFRQRFGLDKNENFEGSWHLHGYISESALAATNTIKQEELHQQLHALRQYFFKIREQRTHPDTDTKILCGWNGLMIHGMAKAGRLLNRTEYTDSALKATMFIKQNCWQNNRLSASYMDDQANLNAYLDDYVFVLYGVLELLQNQWHNDLYNWSLQLADRLLDDFEDENYGGFFFTSHDHEKLIQRLKSFSDDAIPSGNAIAALTLNRLGYLAGEQRYIESAEKCLKSARASIENAPVSHCALLNALHENLNPPDILIIRNHDDDWNSLIQQYYLADTLVYTIPAELTPHHSLQSKAATDSNIAYPCHGKHCKEAIKTRSQLIKHLENNSYRILE